MRPPSIVVLLTREAFDERVVLELLVDTDTVTVEGIAPVVDGMRDPLDEEIAIDGVPSKVDAVELDNVAVVDVAVVTEATVVAVRVEKVSAI